MLQHIAHGLIMLCIVACVDCVLRECSRAVPFTPSPTPSPHPTRQTSFPRHEAQLSLSPAHCSRLHRPSRNRSLLTHSTTSNNVFLAASLFPSRTNATASAPPAHRRNPLSSLLPRFPASCRRFCNFRKTPLDPLTTATQPCIVVADGNGAQQSAQAP